MSIWKNCEYYEAEHIFDGADFERSPIFTIKKRSPIFTIKKKDQHFLQ